MFAIDNTPIDIALRALLLGPVALIWIVTIVRIVGLRSFSKMTAFDFVVTLATGSLLASAASASSWSAYVQAVLAIAVLLGMQAVLALGRMRSARFRRLLENDPVLILHEGQFLHATMRAHRITEADVLAKLREADAACPEEVSAVVLETTGDISVITTGPALDRVLTDVRAGKAH